MNSLRLGEAWLVATGSALALARSPHAAEGAPRTEIIGALGAYEIQSGYPAQLTLGANSLAFGAGREITGLLELGLRGSFETYSSTDLLPGGTKLFVTAGPVFNFPVNEAGLAGAFFVFLGAGINYNHLAPYQPAGTLYYAAGMSTLGLAYSVEFGKRFALLPTVSWMPTLSVSGYVGSDIFNDNLISYPSYAAIPLRFSVHF